MYQLGMSCSGEVMEGSKGQAQLQAHWHALLWLLGITMGVQQCRLLTGFKPGMCGCTAGGASDRRQGLIQAHKQL